MWILVLESGFAILAVLVALAAPNIGGGLWVDIECGAARLASRRPWLAILLIGISAPALRLSLLPIRPIPEPAIHDEFSYLLAADTFASGRLTNPVHPMWVHFETFHVDQLPTYMSMYPPAQGLALALGKVLFGHPWFGVCIAVGLMCACTCWMLYGWLPPGWALLGGVLIVARIGVFSYWTDSYWGGAVPAIGGAIVMGALPRLLKRPRAVIAILLGIGLLLLANSRPYEGLLLASPVAVKLFSHIAGNRRPPAGVSVRRIVLPVSAVLLAGAGLMAYYNWRVFGSPVTLPYQINRATYAVAPVFIWQSPRPEPAYRHAIMRDFYTNEELQAFRKACTLPGYFDALGTKLGLLGYFFWGPLFGVPVLMLPWALRDRRTRFISMAIGFYLAGESLNAFSQAHYLAPATAPIYLVLVQSLRHLRSWRLSNQPTGRFLARALPALCIVMLIVHGAGAAVQQSAERPRSHVERALEQLPGRQLAIVRYRPGHEPMSEWVYNDANIDDAKVVWARDMSDDENLELLRYFKGRTAWLIEPDATPPRMSRYVSVRPDITGAPPQSAQSETPSRHQRLPSRSRGF